MPDGQSIGNFCAFSKLLEEYLQMLFFYFPKCIPVLLFLLMHSLTLVLISMRFKTNSQDVI